MSIVERFSREQNVAAFPLCEPENVHQSILDKLKEFLNTGDDYKAKEALTHWMKNNLSEQILAD